MVLVWILRRMVGWLMEVPALRRKGGRMSDHPLVEGRLIADQGWNRSRRVGGEIDVYLVNRENGFYQGLMRSITM